MNKPEAPMDLGVYSRKAQDRGMSAIELIAVGLSAVWLLSSGIFFLVVGRAEQAEVDPLRFVMVLMAIFLPVAMIWIAATTARSVRAMREESEHLQATIDAMRKVYVAQTQAAATAVQPAVERKIDQIVASQAQTQAALTTFQSTRQVKSKPPGSAPAPAAATGDQPALELGTAAEDNAPTVNTIDYILALNFPLNADDREGFAALRRALKDRRANKLITASQDVLTLLSQEGIYMDDLTPDRARPEVWRRFAEGQRGGAISELGGIRDRSSLALAAARMRQDSIFRDAAHHFLRTFDHSFAAFAPTATDQEIIALAETRTARAFMLLGRVTGIFD